MANYVTIKRSSQLPMLMASDIDLREVESLNAEILDILAHVIGPRAVRLWQHPIRISSTFCYYVFSLLSDRRSPGQGFCGIQMWFPQLDERTMYGGFSKRLLDPMGSLSFTDLMLRREQFMIFTISCMEAWIPYVGLAMHKSFLSIKQLVLTLSSDDSDEAATGEGEGESGEEPGQSDGGGGRGPLEGTTQRSFTADYAGSYSLVRWFHRLSIGLRESQGDPQFKWAGSLFTHSHLLLFLLYGVYFSPVLRLHGIRLINATRISTNMHRKVNGGAYSRVSVQDRINLKILAWLVGSRLGLLAVYGGFRWYQESQGGGNEPLESVPITVDSMSAREYHSSMQSGAGGGGDSGVCHPNEMKKRTCPLCVDTIKNPIVTRCGHVYCHTCLYDMMRRTSTNFLDGRYQNSFPCPICRAEITINKLRHLYF